MEFLKCLDAPGREFTPIPFWFLNGDLTMQELRRQLRDFAAHGVYGVVLHPRIGMAKRIGYLSDTYFRYIRCAVETAAELEMKIVLYDDGMYPSGSAGGQIVAARPDLASQAITLTYNVCPDDEVLVETDQGTLVARRSGGTMRGLHWGEDDGEEHAPATADILNPETVKRFLSLTHERYWQELKAYFGTVIIGFFTDEPNTLGRNTAENLYPWTHGFASVFTAAGGNLADLTALFRNEENSGTALYRTLMMQRENQVYYAALSEWCENHGIGLMGHPHESDDIEAERFFAVPGQDLVLRMLGPESGGVVGTDSVMGKCSADAARLMGRRRNSNECFGACNRNGNPWQFSGGDMKWYTDYLAVRGVNLFIPHAFYYSIAGKRSQERPPDVGPNSIWWPYYKKWADYFSRLSWLMTDAQLVARVVVPCRNRDLHSEQVRPLFERQTGFQYLPESLWPECTVENGMLCCRGRYYQAVLGGHQFPQVPRYTEETVAPDLRCVPPQPELRCASVVRMGRMCWLLVNEGNTPLDAEITLPIVGAVGQYDLWNARAFQWSPCASAKIHLPIRSSLLLFSCSSAEFETLPTFPDPLELPEPVFTLTEHFPKRIQKCYRGELFLSNQTELSTGATLTLDAEEMAELKVNGQAAGVAFWSPQQFEIGELLHPGKNILELTVTGSLANRYGHPVFYGLRKEHANMGSISAMPHD